MNVMPTYQDLHREVVTCKCGHVHSDYFINERIFKNGTHHFEARCAKCEKFIKYVQGSPAHKSICYLPKHRGKTIGEVVKIDRRYAQWVAENLSGGIEKKFQQVLESIPIEQSDTFLDTPFTITKPHDETKKGTTQKKETQVDEATLPF